MGSQNKYLPGIIDIIWESPMTPAQKYSLLFYTPSPKPYPIYEIYHFSLYYLIFFSFN